MQNLDESLDQWTAQYVETRMMRSRAASASTG